MVMCLIGIEYIFSNRTLSTYRCLTFYREEIKEDEKGLGLSVLTDSIAALEHKKKKQGGKIVRLGMMRHLNLVIDFSDTMLDQDLKPTRQLCTLKVSF